MRGLALEERERFQHRDLRIVGMDCADCAVKLENGISKLDGVVQCKVDFVTSKMTLTYDAQTADQARVIERIHQMGCDVATENPVETRVQTSEPFDILAFVRGRRRNVLTLVGGVFILLAAVLGAAGVPPVWVHVFYALAIATSGYFMARKGLVGLWINRELDINFLATVAAVGAVAIGAWTEGALVVFLFGLGEMLEDYTMERARNAIRAMMALAPSEATVLRPRVNCEEHRGKALPDGSTYESGPCPWCGAQEERVAVAELSVGDVILVRPGERIPMDGRVIRGISTVNQAPITGESMPVSKRVGDEVFAGTINGEGALEIEVTRLAADNTLSRIIHMVEEAQARKGVSQRWVDTFARYYTPAVVGFAVLIATLPPVLFGQPFLEPISGGHGWLYRALALLIIACPCALVISTPVSIVSAISHAAQEGVLVKGGAYLEAVGQLSVVAFDKTGTLTKGEPIVTDVITFNGQIENRVLGWAAAVESRSEHLLAQAIIAEAKRRSIPIESARDFQAMPGRGAWARVGDTSVYVGNRSLLSELAIAIPSYLSAQVERLESEGKTVIFVVREAQRSRAVVGIIAVADTVRPEARGVVSTLRQLGIRRVVMLTGDNERTAAVVAAQVGVDDVRAGLLPGQKVDAIGELLDAHGRVAMVGDGVNDAPALARATVGIAMGGAGTDQVLETADIVLMADELVKLPLIMHLARRTLRTVRQNIGFSLLVKAAFMGLAIPGIATLWMAVFADVGASLIVILNGMRLLGGGNERMRQAGDEGLDKIKAAAL
ncbi:MAG: heavy metal translocating P-type ATPase [Anaerolineae bacterium]|nr:heavy metal translocating P-type ATPase [Anaerolineae bacterium]